MAVGKYKILLARTCSLNIEHPRVGTWLFQEGMALGQDPRCAEAYTMPITEHRIHCARNQAAKYCLDNNIDYLLFVDSDMGPDFRFLNPCAPKEQQPEAREWAKPFTASSLNFMRTQYCGVIGAPAVSGPPQNKINVFIPREGADPSRITDEEYAKTEPHFMNVWAIGTGLMLIDVECFRRIKPPWFDDLWFDDYQMDVRISQDSHFCVKCNMAGIPVFANLYAPAEHMKVQAQRPPDWVGSKK